MMEPGEIYHLYNHANGSEDLFRDEADYELFLNKVLEHTSHLFHFYSYCLMPNHFHFVIETKEDDELRELNIKVPEKVLSKAFGNACSGYAKKINHKYNRMGSLFNQNHKTKIILDEKDFCKVVHYVHANPVHHGFTSDISKWKYSSYNRILLNDTPWLKSKKVYDYFGNVHEFIKYHQQDIELKVKPSIY